tara:strand:+ start:86 stop:397 length:312 start_codon:yes stop_codon:yes gene_type:complete
MSGDYETHNDRQPKIKYAPIETDPKTGLWKHPQPVSKNSLKNTRATATYHIYLNDKCLFKNLNEEEFDLIWEKIYRSYFKEELTYAECIEDTCLVGLTEEHSY